MPAAYARQVGTHTRLLLAGDVMTGRGVDQVLPDPGDPRLYEDYVTDARTYVELAEQVNGAVPAPVPPAWPWGDTLQAMARCGPAVRVMNLETAVTRSDDLAPAKAVRYRMSPANLDVLRTAAVDVWALANNHVLDHGVSGLEETLDSLHGAGLVTAGAGRHEAEAWRPSTAGYDDRRVVVLSVAHRSSGVPGDWAATRDRPGVALLPDLTPDTADAVAARLREAAAPGDVRVVSVHWGGNWGYEVPRDHRRFAHRLVEQGIDVVHGHSSHHPRPVEVHRGRLVLYGCGDLVDDYEGIRGYESFRDDLRLLYLVRLDARTGELQELRMIPFQARRLRLQEASPQDVRWLADTLDHASRSFGSRVVAAGDGSLVLRPR